MSIYLGNLTVEHMEQRTGVTFSSELKELLKGTHQSNAANVAVGKWHCFDIPFVLVCGGREFAQKVYDQLKPMQSEFKEPLQIALGG